MNMRAVGAARGWGGGGGIVVAVKEKTTAATIAATVGVWREPSR
jgi:hypothetical protein